MAKLGNQKGRKSKKQEIQKSRNSNTVGNKKEVGNWNMQEIKISRKLENVRNHKKKSRKSKKVGNRKKQEI